MKINNYKRINEIDFPENSRGIVKQLSLLLNPFLEEINRALNKKLTLTENIQSLVKELDNVKSDGTYNIKLDFTPNGVIVISSDKVLKTSPFVNWTKSGDGITIGSIIGLEDNTTYKLKLLVI